MELAGTVNLVLREFAVELLSVAEQENALTLSLVLIEISLVVDPLFSQLAEIGEIEGMAHFLGQVVVHLAMA